MLPHLPTITGVVRLYLAIAQNKKPIVIGNDPNQTRNSCREQLNFDHIFCTTQPQEIKVAQTIDSSIPNMGTAKPQASGIVQW
jgi:glutamate-1-semialdehyde aminotransferase